MDFLLQNIKQIILALGVFFLLLVIVKNFAKINKFISEVKSELKKVSWPTRQELIFATMMVVAVTAVLTVFIGCVDVAFAKALNLIIK